MTRKTVQLLNALLPFLPDGSFSGSAAIRWVKGGKGGLTAVAVPELAARQVRQLVSEKAVRWLLGDVLPAPPPTTTTDQGGGKQNAASSASSTSSSSSPLSSSVFSKMKNLFGGAGWAKRLAKPSSSKKTRRPSATSASSASSTSASSTTSPLPCLSAQSRQLASCGTGDETKGDRGGGVRSSAAPTSAGGTDATRSVLYDVCRLYAMVLWRWPATSSSSQRYAMELLNGLGFKTTLVASLWGHMEAHGREMLEVEAYLDSVLAAAKHGHGGRGGGSRGGGTNKDGVWFGGCDRGLAMVALLCDTFSHLLVVLDDFELHDQGNPMPLPAIERMVHFLKRLLFDLLWNRQPTPPAPAAAAAAAAAALGSSSSSPSSIPSPSSSSTDDFLSHLLRVTGKLMSGLYDRSSRRPLCHADAWLVAQPWPGLSSQTLFSSFESTKNKRELLVDLLGRRGGLAGGGDGEEEGGGGVGGGGRGGAAAAAAAAAMSEMEAAVDGGPLSPKQRDLQRRCVRVLRAMPYAVSFDDRLRLFETLARKKRAVWQADGTLHALRVRIRRGSIFEDGFRGLNRYGRELRKRIYVEFINAAGERESGIDAGGLFKDFWTRLSAIIFNPNYGLFKTTEDQLMYPSPDSALLHGADEHLELYAFLGRVMGKALFENMVVQPQFAHFFLRHLLGKFNSITALPSLDPALYKNLMFLKTYTGDAADLCLTFSIGGDELSHGGGGGQGGVDGVVDLIPGGRDVDVDDDNKMRYIYLVAHHRLNVALRAQSAAFLGGLRDIVPHPWLRMFSEPELQLLISGKECSVEPADLRRHTTYANGYSDGNAYVKRFWSAVDAMDPPQRAKLLQFVTSCERPPPLGFEAMEPPFCIQRVPISNDADRLPTAATCFNTLKLPTYSSTKVMLAKLIYCIESNAGFEMS